MSLGLAMVVLLAGQSLVKALLAMLVGLWVASIGTDLFTAQSRFTFGQSELLYGVDFVVVAIGVFALGEVLGEHGSARGLGDAAGSKRVAQSVADAARSSKRAASRSSMGR